MVATLLSISQVEGIHTHNKGKYVETESTTQEMLNDVTFVPGEPVYSNDWGSMVQLSDKHKKQWPSVARCRVADGTTDETACDDAGPPEHAKFHDDVVGRTPMGPTSENLLPGAKAAPPKAAAFLDISA